jgi:formimidoylglutamate deiminase
MKFFARLAWVNGKWQNNVELTVNDQGYWQDICVNSKQVSEEAIQLGAILPGITDAHSHAFQRAMVGLSEQSSPAGDNFWRWRQTMYRLALTISPTQLQKIATWLYAELLSQGYTQICEFHYIHRSPNGQPYSDPTEMSWALVQAAQSVGMGITVLPTLYEHRGFDRQGLQDDQRRFASSPESILNIRDAIDAYAKKHQAQHLINTGVAFHSLRAVAPNSIHELLVACRDHPIHIHVSEQLQEVKDCVAQTGLRPVEWLHKEIGLDHRWNLVHATHTSTDELNNTAKSKASVVICPITEANLGDGIFDLTGALHAGLNCSLGTDSHTNRDWAAELRSLEYSLRLTKQARNIAFNNNENDTSTGQVLFNLALNGGSAAAGQALAGIEVGQRADFFELETKTGPLAGVPDAYLIDALIFSTPSKKPKKVFVAGEIIKNNLEKITYEAIQSMSELWGSPTLT